LAIVIPLIFKGHRTSSKTLGLRLVHSFVTNTVKTAQRVSRSVLRDTNSPGLEPIDAWIATSIRSEHTTAFKVVGADQPPNRNAILQRVICRIVATTRRIHTSNVATGRFIVRYWRLRPQRVV
jgi:hypothetical protein